MMFLETFKHKSEATLVMTAKHKRFQNKAKILGKQYKTSTLNANWLTRFAFRQNLKLKSHSILKLDFFVRFVNLQYVLS